MKPIGARRNQIKLQLGPGRLHLGIWEHLGVTRMALPLSLKAPITSRVGFVSLVAHASFPSPMAKSLGCPGPCCFRAHAATARAPPAPTSRAGYPPSPSAAIMADTSHPPSTRTRAAPKSTDTCVIPVPRCAFRVRAFRRRWAGGREAEEGRRRMKGGRKGERETGKTYRQP